MNVNDALRLIAGVVVVLSAVLAHFVHPNWIWLTVFVGANLFKSAFTKWCPMMVILRKAGVRD